MATRILSLEQLERLKVLENMPDTVIVPTLDAALLDGSAVSTWEKKRRLGQTPPAFNINARALGYQVGDIKARRAARAETKVA